MPRDEAQFLRRAWVLFQQSWVENDQTHNWYRDWEGGWRVCIRPDQQEAERWEWAVFNHETKIGDMRSPFDTRLAAAKNAFAQVMIWSDRVSEIAAAEWLQSTQEVRKLQSIA